MPDRDYSGTPLHRKLGIREGSAVALLDAPEGFPGLLAPLPGGVELRRAAGEIEDDTALRPPETPGAGASSFRAGHVLPLPPGQPDRQDRLPAGHRQIYFRQEFRIEQRRY